LTAGQSGEEERTVLVELVLRKSGAVRDARVFKGPTTLRAAAIKAVKRRNYKNYILNVWPGNGEITVAVKFPQDKAGAPEITQVLPAGVPSCIPVPKVVRISPDVMRSRLLNRVEPAYPAGIQNIEGSLVLQVHIDKDGNAYDAEKISGPDALVPAAIAAIKNWKYRPFLLNGEPVEVETTVDLKFPD
jgi:outer membrane biosynthesis protein TonB